MESEGSQLRFGSTDFVLPHTPARKQPLLELFFITACLNTQLQWVGGSGESRMSSSRLPPSLEPYLHYLSTNLHTLSPHCPTPPNK